jgi:sec-independent protein translocase protein TatB
MFDVGWSEMVVIGVVALIAIGPKELPGVLRAIGQWVGKARRMAAEFQGQFQEAMREAELAEIKKEIDSVARSGSDIDVTTPISTLQKEVEDSLKAGAPAEMLEGTIPPGSVALEQPVQTPALPPAEATPAPAVPEPPAPETAAPVTSAPDPAPLDPATPADAAHHDAAPADTGGHPDGKPS